MEEYYPIPEPATMNINYQWWCLKCQDWHGSPYCPWDITGFLYIDDSADNKILEICPHCGHLIRLGGLKNG